MSYALYQERLSWFDRRVRDGRYPNARQLAGKFEVSHRTAKRLIGFMRDRLRAPLVYNSRRRGYAYEDDSFGSGISSWPIRPHWGFRRGG